MQRSRLISAAIIAAGVALPAVAHNAICDCFYDEDDPNKVICEGGFSDGSPATGIPMRVVGRDGKVLIDGAMDEMSEFTFSKPDVDFKVEFDAGEGHVVQIDGRDIEEY